MLNTGSLEGFFNQWHCTPEERNLLVLYLAVVRLKTQLDGLARWVHDMNMVDGEGI